ncbi:MAG: cation:proton antiporter [Alistipes sp.]|nr:cation:proton antiporter [Alistipes sp.]
MSRVKRNYITYTCMVILFAIIMALFVHYAPSVSTVPSASSTRVAEQADGSGLFYEVLTGNLRHPLSLLLLQMIAILLCVRLFSWIFRYLGQPGVIGEIVAGIVLGPSLLGHLFPETFAFLFSPESLVPLHVISQIGLVLFMFVIGMELDPGVVRRKASETLLISHASIIVPFLLGMGLAFGVYPEFGAGHTQVIPFALFVAISVSITAFPVLARIIQERNLGKSPMGMLTLASAANNDVTAWCLLAGVIAVARAGAVTGALYTLALTAVYLWVMFWVVKPLMCKLGERYNHQETVSKPLVGAMFLVLIVSSYLTEILGIHALFGAFLAGVVMPPNLSFRRVLTEKLEDVALVLFLPLFFVFTGLRTEIGTLNTPHLWGVCLLFIVISVAGKMIGATGAARWAGESWRDSLSIGILMNTRGLMELIVLNIGYDMGIIPAPLFVIFVIMALVTTFMATPLLILLERWSGYKKSFSERVEAKHTQIRILVSFANPQSAPLFLKLIQLLYGKHLSTVHITALHYTIGTDTNLLNTQSYANESFAPLQREAARLNLAVETRYRVTDRYTEDLCALAESERFDLVLTGAGPGFLGNYIDTPRPSGGFDPERRLANLLNRSGRWLPPVLPLDKVRVLFQSMQIPFGVFIHRNLPAKPRVAILLRNDRDLELLHLAEPMPAEIHRAFYWVDAQIPHAEMPQVTLAPSIAQVMSDCELVLVSYAAWQYIVRNQRPALRMLPSCVILKPTK